MYVESVLVANPAGSENLQHCAATLHFQRVRSKSLASVANLHSGLKQVEALHSLAVVKQLPVKTSARDLGDAGQQAWRLSWPES